MKPLPPFVFIAPNKSETSMGSGFILNTAPPFHLGRIVKLPAETYSFALMQYKTRFKPLLLAEVSGYSILIAYEGNLFNERETDLQVEVQNVFNEMAEFFKLEKVNNSLGYFKRFKL